MFASVVVQASLEVVSTRRLGPLGTSEPQRILTPQMAPKRKSKAPSSKLALSKSVPEPRAPLIERGASEERTKVSRKRLRRRSADEVITK